MIPVYFPFTDMPETVSFALLSCFEKIAVYHPDGHLVPESLRALSTQHRLDLRFPDFQDPDPLPALLKEYHSWAELHQGETPAFYKFGASPSPFSDDTSTAWIRSRIQPMETVSTDEKSDDRLLTARLFLAVSQEYDRQEASLSHDLHRINAREKALFQELSPDLETILPIVPDQSSPAPDTCRPMPEKRLTAWALLYFHCSRHTPAAETFSPPLFVTSDGEILAHLLAMSNAPPLVCTVSGLPCHGGDKPAWNPVVSEQIEAVLTESIIGKSVPLPREISYAEAGNCHEKTASLSIFRIDRGLYEAFLAGTSSPADYQESSDDGYNSRFFFMGYVALA